MRLAVTGVRLTIVGCLLVAAACGSDAAKPRLDKYYGQHPDWGSCAEFPGVPSGSGLECAHVTVPIDYDKPNGDTARIALSRLRASGNRIGSLLMNPGGPGQPGLTLPLALAVPRTSPVAQRFDLVGFDPRGLGASTPRVVCLTPTEALAMRRDLDVDRSPTGIAASEKKSKDYVAKCVQRSGIELLAHVGTREVARDLDVIRSALGDDRLRDWGGSYGTRIGSAYAEAFPSRVRAMVLDGGVDPDADLIDPEKFMAGFQKDFDAFAADCARTADCPLGTDPTRASQRLRALLNPLIEHPAVTEDPRGLSYHDALNFVNLLYNPSEWPILTSALQQLTQGHGDIMLRVADLASGLVDRDLQQAVLCVDGVRVTNRATADDDDRRLRAAAPIMDDGHGTGHAPLGACAFWPVPTTSQPHIPAVSGLPEIVVVGVTGDPATPYQGGVNLARDLGGGLITYQGLQHTVTFKGVPCVDVPVTAYLTDLVPPPANLICPNIGK